jgi:hypothetical protein
MKLDLGPTGNLGMEEKGWIRHNIRPCGGCYDIRSKPALQQNPKFWEMIESAKTAK